MKVSKIVTGTAALGLVGALAVKKDQAIDYAKRAVKPTRYVMYERADFRNMTILDERPLNANTDKYVIMEENVYTTQASCSAPDLDPSPTKNVVPWGVSKVQALQAMEVTDARGVVVCVADSGVARHPDLLISGGYNAISPQASWEDDNGHGTHVAGTISAVANNDRDVVGVSQSPIYASKVLNSWGSGYSSDIAKGIVACVDQGGARVINLSLGGPGEDPLIEQALAYIHSKGAISVCAAGNNGGAVEGFTPHCTYVVSATDKADNLASFSSRGPSVNVAAPGVSILSLSYKGGTETMSGTSMAAPHVSAAVALMLAAGRPSLGYDNINLPPEQMGKGRLNALKTVQ